MKSSLTTRLILVKPELSLTGFATMQDAVAQGAANQNDMRINGEILRSYQFDGSHLVLSFENGCHIFIGCGTNKVDWKIVDKDYELGGDLPPQNIEFELPSGARFRWNWRMVLDSFIGQPLYLSPSNQLMFVSTPQSPEYVVNIYSELGSPDSRYIDISEA